MKQSEWGVWIPGRHPDIDLRYKIQDWIAEKMGCFDWSDYNAMCFNSPEVMQKRLENLK
jgi:hypothetical protein